MSVAFCIMKNNEIPIFLHQSPIFFYLYGRSSYFRNHSHYLSAWNGHGTFQGKNLEFANNSHCNMKWIRTFHVTFAFRFVRDYGVWVIFCFCWLHFMHMLNLKCLYLYWKKIVECLICLKKCLSCRSASSFVKFRLIRFTMMYSRQAKRKSFNYWLVADFIDLICVKGNRIWLTANL